MSSAWFIVINPASGKGKGLPLWQNLKTQLITSDVPFEFAISEYHGHALELIAKKHNEGFRKFLGIGGDGTLNEMAHSILSQQQNQNDLCTLALLPVGTGNDWVRSCDTKLDLKNALAKMKKNKSLLQDVGLIENGKGEIIRYFLNVAGAGLDGQVVKEIEDLSNKGARGKSVYLRGLLRALKRFHSVFADVNSKENKVFSGEVYTITAALGEYFGGGMHISPKASSNKGIIDFTIVKNAALWTVLPQLPRLFNGSIAKANFVLKMQAGELSITTSAKLKVQADGEFVGEHNELAFKNCSKAIRILI